MIRKTGRFTRRERRRTGTTLGLCGLVAVLLAVALLVVGGRRHQLQEEIRAVSGELARFAPAAGEAPLPVRLREDRYTYRMLDAEWDRYTRLLDGAAAVALPVSTNTGEAALIDFKVALFEARRRVGVLAATNQATVPADLGMSHNMATDENAGSRLLQLAAIERLLTLALETGITEVREVRPLPYDVIPVDPEGGLAVIRYPVVLSLRCSQAQLERLFARVPEAPYLLTLSRLKVEWNSAAQPEAFDVVLTFCLLVRQRPAEPEEADDEEARSPDGGAPR